MLSLLLPAAPSRDELFARHGERYRWLALFTVAIGVIAAVLATTSFSVAVPAILSSIWKSLPLKMIGWTAIRSMAGTVIAKSSRIDACESFISAPKAA